MSTTYFFIFNAGVEDTLKSNQISELLDGI